MDWIVNLISGLIGAVIGGLLTAHSIGRWRGRMETSMEAVQARLDQAAASRKAIHEQIDCIPDLKRWREQVDDRLADGDARLMRIEVLDAKIDETSRSLEAFQIILRESSNEVRTQMAAMREVFVTRDVCNERHRRRQQ